VIDAVTHYYEDVGANIHRGKHYLSEEASTRYERVRYQVGQFLDVPSSEIVFTGNATGALNLVAAGLDLSAQDLVLVPLDAHHSNLVPWRETARVALIRCDAHGAVDLDHYRELLRLRPKVVALSHCSNVTGLYAPLADMVAAARDAGALVVVDAAQSTPHRRLAVKALGVDFMAVSGHKMLGPTGTGVLWGRFELLEKLRPVWLGGGTVDWVDEERHQVRKVPHRFEAGTPHIAGIYGLGAALTYLDRLGREAIEQHDTELARVLLAEAHKRPWLRVLGDAPGADRAALVSLEVRGAPRLGDIARMLSDGYGVMCRTGHLCAQPVVSRLTGGEVLRLSAYVYNSAKEIRWAFEALDEIATSLGLES
jgi:cysteine desulfurase/selenocysteine lyase